MDARTARRRIPWFRISLIALILWGVFGLVPVAVALLDLLSDEQVRLFAPFGDMFGAANAFFTGFALVAVLISIEMQTESLAAQREELELTRTELHRATAAQRTMAEQQQKALALQVVLPFMNEIASEEFRKASLLLAELERKGRVAHYGELRDRRDRSPEEVAEFDRLDAARRRFVHLFHKMHRLHESGVVDDETVRVVIGPDLVWFLLHVDEPMEEAIRANYSRAIFDYFQSLYPFDEIAAQWPRNPANPLSRRLETALAASRTDRPTPS